MTDQKLIAGIFNDFLGLYTGKIQTGIRPLIEKYKSHPMLMGLRSNLDEAAKIQAPKEKKKIQKEWDSVNKRTKTIPKNQGTKKDSEVHPKEAAEQEEKHISSKKSKDSGQMSLFDMMQPKES